MANYALVVGINCYPTYSSLAGAVADADQVEQWLRDPKGGNVPVANCRRVQSRSLPPDLLARLPQTAQPPTPTICPNFAEVRNDADLLDDIMAAIMPKQDDIDRQLQRLLLQAANDKKDGNKPERFFFYFSGHGISHDSQEVGLCLSNFSISWKGNNLLMEKYRECVISQGLFQELVFWLDCCRTRELNVPGHAPNLPPRLLSPGELAAKTAVFYAAEYLSPAYETQQGFFTKTLLDGLRGGAADHDGYVTYGTLQNYLDHRLPVASGGRQKASVRLSDGAALTDAVLAGPVEVVAEASTNQTYPLTAELPQNYSAVRLYNARNQSVGVVVAGQRVTARAKQPQGQYYLVVELPGEVQTIQINLPQTTPAEVASPPAEGAAVIRGYHTTHEEFAYPVKYLSTTKKRQVTPDADAELLLFVRTKHPGQLPPGQSIGEHLWLYNDRGEQVTDLNKSDYEPGFVFGPDRGFLAYAARLRSGTYQLRYTGDTPRQMPIYVTANWQTQLFLLYENVPQFESARLFLARPGHRFAGLSELKHEEHESRLADDGFTALQNAQSRPTPDLLTQLLDGKFSNPMLGITALCLLLRGRLNGDDWYAEFLEQRADTLKEAERYLYRVVLHNLYRLLPPIAGGNVLPDLLAVTYLIERTVAPGLAPVKLKKVQFDQPPSLLYLTQQISRLALDDDKLIPVGSPFARILPLLYTDGPLTTHKPTDDNAATDWTQLDPYQIDAVSKVVLLNTMSKYGEGPAGLGGTLGGLLGGLLGHESAPDLESVIAGMHGQEKDNRSSSDEGMSELARQLNLPMTSVKTMMEAIASAPPTELLKHVRRW